MRNQEYISEKNTYKEACFIQKKDEKYKKKFSR